ncbi:MAG TPA: glycerophosphodiester phosphodiesterase family protein [Allosphingosinicella sp.]|jgi:glycerophosphoryl diester phosphodiesterase
MPSSRSRQAELQRLAERPFAHRGLHGGGRIENSRAAFQAALDGGFGIELDVQESADGAAFVFHDDRLERLAEAEGLVRDRSSAELRTIRLRGSGETIPGFTEVLRLVSGRAGLLVEVKSPGSNVAPLCASVAEGLRDYGDPVAVMSFNPAVGRWFRRNAPNLLRGLVVTEQDRRGARGRVERRLALWWSGADFLACDIRDLPSRFAARARQRGLPVYTWTVRTHEERVRAAAHADQIIFEAAAR